LYWTGRSAPDGSANSPNEFSITKNINGTAVTKNFNKRKIRFKGPNSTNYSELLAEENAIYYPNSSDAFIYSAYAEVTDYVQQHGIGTYFAADIALVEGNGSSTGYSGGWGLVVIYENSKMKQRDITVFDGHAFVLNSTSNGYNLEVNGFHTLPVGNVGVKLGIMASEGDVGLNGDYFQIQKNSDLTFTKLHHAQNSEDNFFNSSNTNPDRNPALTNNTGIDIATFSVPNDNNAVIGNNQTRTNFRYGTIGDTYAIFALVLAVDSYLPKVENTISVSSVNGNSYAPNSTVKPDQEISLSINIRNLQNESISNYKMVVPMPYNVIYLAGSAQGIMADNPTLSNASNIHFDANQGSYGALVWNYGVLPSSMDPNQILGNLHFKVKVTNDCYFLKNSACNNSIYFDGYASGTGSISGITINSCPFIIGKTANGNCSGDIIKGPLAISIDVAEFIEINCTTDTIRNFSFCGEQNEIAVTEIASHFPPGCNFSNTFPLTANSIVYQGSDTIPLQAGTSLNYFAFPSNLGNNCSYPFQLTKCTEIIANTDIGGTINSSFGGTAFTNILANDFINGHEIEPSEVEVTIVSSPVSGISLVGTDVLVAPGTAAGNYIVTYQICDNTDPSKCKQAEVHFIVSSININAQNDSYVVECSSIGTIGNILNNDTLNGMICQGNDIDITIISNSMSNIAINPQSGEIYTLSELSTGNYILQYKIYPNENPTDFAIATITISAIDSTPPEAPLLNDLVSYCEVTAVAPVTTDACSGSVMGFTNDPLVYDLPGDYVIHWYFTDSSSNTTVANQNVKVKDNVDSVPGYGYIDCNLDNDPSLIINLNSFLSEGINTNGAWTSTTNTTNLSGSLFSPYQASTGNYEFQYLFTENECSQSAQVTIEVNNDCYVAPACNLLVHNSFSPNNDGINEVFVIENIDQVSCFPSNSVEIYNRWGVLVFKTTQYDNVSRVFRGISEGRATVNESNQLPTGTYFYSIKYTNSKGSEEEQSGYVYLVM
jgi:gliding motility-associated-like protein